MADYIKPAQTIGNMVEAGATKASLSAGDLLVRSALAGACLGFVTSLALLIAGQTGQFVAGALVFPAGFALIVILGLELLTGNFAIMPVALFSGRITPAQLASNWLLVFIGNLAGSLIYAVLLWIAVTDAGHTTGGLIGNQLRTLAAAKTTAYQAFGAAGLLTVFTKAVLCNWMVSLGSVMGLASSSTTGKILGCWLPIFIFVEQGFEHSVVNMFAIPAGIMLGAKVGLADWWLWNEIPVTLGNMVGAVVFTAAALYLTYGRTPASPQDMTGDGVGTGPTMLVPRPRS